MAAYYKHTSTEAKLQFWPNAQAHTTEGSASGVLYGMCVAW